MQFSWIAFYEQIADKLAAYADKRKDLFAKVRAAAHGQPLMHYLHFENSGEWQARDNEIDPFTVMGVVNRGVTAEHRAALGECIADMLGVSLAPPKVFHGIPHLDPRKSIYEGNDEMWNLFAAALNPSKDFATAYDAAKNVRGNALGTLTIGLFWMRPKRFMPVDSISGPYIEAHYGLAMPDEKCGGAEYQEYMKKLDAHLPKDMDYPALAHAAWQEKNQ